MAPWITMKISIESISKTLREEYSSEAQRTALSERIFLQTSTPLIIDDNITAETFHQFFTGSKLRWEILGLVFTNLALALDSLMDSSDLQISNQERQSFARELTHASNIVVGFCTRAESLNDLIVWLLHGNAILLTLHYGDTSKFFQPSVFQLIFLKFDRSSCMVETW
jgi:hypothetical protein